MAKAPDDLLELLHGLLAEDMKRKLQAGETDASTLNAIRQFLKDNGISGVMSGKGDDPLRNLASELRGLNLPDDNQPLN